MKNHSKILCVVLALIVALSAASCSLTKQHAYKDNDIELPIGVYIYYLQSAYSQAEQKAQSTDKYDSETGKYNGKKSFLKMELTMEDGEDPVVAEDWIKEEAEKNTKHAVAVMDKFNELGCTIDESVTDGIKESWDQYKEQFEPYGIGLDSIEMIVKLSSMEQEVLYTEYGTGGPSEVSDKEITDLLKKDYTSYKTISVNLYETQNAEATDGSEETQTTTVPLSEDQINAYKKSFDSYASTLSKGASFDEVSAKYMKDYSVEEDPTQSSVEIIKDDDTDEIKKAIKGMKDGQAMTLEVGEDDSSKQLYLIYREPIEDEFKAYTDPDQKKNEFLSEIKHDDFEDMLDELAKDIKLDSACNGYKPSLFEDNKKNNKTKQQSQ